MVLSIICMAFAIWACVTLGGDLTCGVMAVVFAAAAYWGFKKIRG